MRRLIAVAFAVAALVALPLAASAQTTTIKLGTMAPDGSTWHNLLKQMGERWSEASGGKVKLKIYAGGVAGNEGDMVRKLRVGQLNAAALSVVGLHDIETSAQCVAAPGLIGDQAEHDYVFAKLQPILEKRFLEKGFMVLNWGDTGTVQLFVNKDVHALADLHGIRMFAWSGDPSASKAWELAGFQPVVISSTDIAPSLQTGIIQGFATSPIMAFTARWYENAKTMLTGTWGHLPGGTVVTRDVWEKVPADIRPKILAIAREMGAKVNTEVLKMQAEAIEQMKKNGLKTVDLPSTETKGFVEMAERTWPAVRGGVCSEQAFDEVRAVRDEYRGSKGKK